MQKQVIHVTIFDANMVRQGEIDVTLPTKGYRYQQPRAELGNTDEVVAAVKDFCKERDLPFPTCRWFTL